MNIVQLQISTEFIKQTNHLSHLVPHLHIRKGAVCSSTLTVAYVRPLNANSLASTLLLARSFAVAKTEFNMWSGARVLVVVFGCRLFSSCPIHPEVSRVCWLPSQSCT